jgi:hypothetical protein
MAVKQKLKIRFSKIKKKNGFKNAFYVESVEFLF